MAWYYGVNNSELYGSNFSTVLADAPPPLDDTYDEDENEIVFPNEAKKLKKYNGETVASSTKNSNSSEEKFSDKSKHDGNRLPNGENQPEGQGSVDEDSDFGDFAGFADFGSAFGQEDSGESQNWFTGDENRENSLQAVNEHADFAAFQDNDSSLNQENIPNGGSEQGNDFYNYNQNGLGNRNHSSNDSYDVDSEDDFGDFASMEKTTKRPDEISPKNDSNNKEIQSDLEKSSASQERTCSESNTKSDDVDVSSERNIVQYNGDVADEKVASLHGESTVNHTSEGSPDVNKGQENEFGTKRDTSSVENISNAVVKEVESMPLDNSSVHHKDIHPCDSSMGVLERGKDQGKDNRANTVLSSNKEKDSSESAIKSDEAITTKTNLNNVNTCKSGSEEKTSPEINELNDDDDGFGEFADFTVPSMKQPSFRNDDDEVISDKEIPDSPGISVPVDGGGNEDASCTGIASVQHKDDHNDDSNEFGDFGSFDQENHHNYESKTDFVAVYSKTECLSTENDDDDDFGEFGISNSEGKTFPAEDQGSDDFSDFGAFNSRTEDSHNEDDDNDFEGFGTSSSGEKPLPVEVQENDDFGDFGTFDSSSKDSQKDSDINHELGDSGGFESNIKDSKKDDDDNDDFGDFGTFESNTKHEQKDDCNSNSFGDFGSFDVQATDTLEKNESDNEFGDFGAFESKVKDVPKEEQRNSNVKDFSALESKDDNTFGDFGTSDSPQKSQVKKNESDDFSAFNISKNMISSRKTDDDFGDFSSKKGNAGSFTSFPTSHFSVSSESSPRMSEDLKQRETETYFVPGTNVIIKQVGDPISLCFISEQRYISDSQCDVLSSRVEKSLQSNVGLWQQLERSDKEGRILFRWSNSFSQHKKLLSLTIRPDRPPPLQGGSMLKPMVSSQFSPFGGGLAGSILMPEPPSKLQHFSSGLGFLEPNKGSRLPVQSTTQIKTASHQSAHPEMGLPDLSFVLGNDLKHTASKSDIKDNVSDTTSESSSLDLDFFAPSTTQPSDGKPESRGLYEEDMLGLNIFSSSLEPEKLKSPKLQKTSDTKKVWQRGGVTIPLSSQERRAQLSAAAKSILNELEDLRFMSSSVLMFPLKPE